MFFAAQESRHHLAGVLGTMLEIYDLDGGLEIQAAPVLQTKGKAFGWQLAQADRR